jgi:hypothetical protein
MVLYLESDVSVAIKIELVEDFFDMLELIFFEYFINFHFEFY